MARNKYGNKKVTFMGKKFDSIGERNRFVFLQNAEKLGKIKDLQTQVSYQIEVNGKKICRYVPDFVYMVGENQVVEDFKGVETAVFRLKKKLMLACLDIDVKVVKAPTEAILQ